MPEDKSFGLQSRQDLFNPGWIIIPDAKEFFFPYSRFGQKHPDNNPTNVPVRTFEGRLLRIMNASPVRVGNRLFER